MKLINNRWVDENNNSWSANFETKKSARKKSNSLTNCSDCSNCSNCSYCSRCSGCSYCSGCSDCSGCINCSNCSYCLYCTGCSYCSGCSDCSYCSGCSDCSGCINCSNFKSNPERIISAKMGSRNSQTTYYYNGEHEQVVCGCFKGTLNEFEKRVHVVHGENEHGVAYQKWIDKVRIYKN